MSSQRKRPARLHGGPKGWVLANAPSIAPEPFARKPIRAELSGSDQAVALDIVAISTTPVLLLCRKLIEARHDPFTPLEAWRGQTRCLRVRSIGEAASLRIRGDGMGFERLPARPTAPLVRPPDDHEENPTACEAA